MKTVIRKVCDFVFSVILSGASDSRSESDAESNDFYASNTAVLSRCVLPKGPRAHPCKTLRKTSAAIYALTTLLLLTVPACHRQSQVRHSPFPDSNETAGWARTSDIRTFSAAELWKYIDGDAERYLKAGVQSVSTADYKFNGRSDGVVDIYTMAGPDGAAKIIESEPAMNAHSAQIGDDCRLYSQSLIFRRGPSLVRITAFQESPETQAALLRLGRAIEQRLGR